MSARVDLLLYNANVLTMDPSLPRAGIVAIGGNRILALGYGDELAGWIGHGTKAIDCEGKTLLPGFNDAHCHLGGLVRALLELDCSPAGASSIDDIKALVRQQAEKTLPGQWIRARGYDEFRLAERRHPTRRDLDAAAPLHPVYLRHHSGHALVLNSRALVALGVTAETPEPPGLIVDREVPSGEPSGILFGTGNLDARIPLLDPAVLEKAAGLVGRRLLSVGITSVQDASASNDLSTWRTFGEWLEKEYIKSRITLMPGVAALEVLREQGFSPGCGDEWLKLGPIKIMLDTTTGHVYPGQAELDRQVLAAHSHGHQVALHALEEDSIAAAVGALEHCLEAYPRPDHRHRIEHCSLCPLDLMARLRHLRAIVVTQPPFLYYSGDRYLAQIPAGSRRWLYPIRSFVEKGLRPAASSDAPVAGNSPLVGIYAAVTRKAATGQVLQAEEAVTAAEAIAMYTTAAAYACFQERERGSIRPGSLADVVLLSADPTSVPPEEIPDIKVELTIVDGKIEWERG